MGGGRGGSSTGGVVIGFERLRVYFGTRAKVEFGVGEEVVRAGAHDEGLADTGVCQGEVAGGGGVCVAH